MRGRQLLCSFSLVWLTYDQVPVGHLAHVMSKRSPCCNKLETNNNYAHLVEEGEGSEPSLIPRLCGRE